MKHLKMLGLVITAAAALMAFAGPAAANPVLTSPAGTAYSGTLTMTASGSHLIKAGFANITCTESTISGKVETNNGTHASGTMITWTYDVCPGVVVETLKHGSITVAPGGRVSATGFEIRVVMFGTSCVYGAKTGTALGTLVGGTPAKLTVSANLPLVSGGFACANPAAWSGSYTVTTPSTLLVH